MGISKFVKAGLLAAAFFMTGATMTVAAQAAGVGEVAGDLVSDIDWTVTYSVRGDEHGLDKSKVIEIQNKFYRVSDHAPEVLYYLSRVEGLRISYFSGGMADRNTSLLKSVPLPDGRTLFDLSKPSANGKRRGKKDQISPRIFSYEDLTQIKVLEDPFTLVNGYAQVIEYFRKDVVKMLPDSSAQNIILVDDREDVVVEGQELNLFWLGETYNFIEDYDAYVAQGHALKRYDPPNKEAWLFERNKWPWIAAVIIEARGLMAAEGFGFAEAVRLVRGRAHLPEFRWRYVNKGLDLINKPRIDDTQFRCSVLQEL